MTAGAEDISTFVFNPAELAYGSGLQALMGITLIGTTGHFEPGSASTVLDTSITGNDGGNSGTLVPLPNLFAATDLPRDFRLGLAATSTYGLGSYWSDGWVGRYYALNSQIVTADIMPTLSYRPIHAVSIGVGLDIQYAEAKTTSAIDFGTIDQAALQGGGTGIPAGSDGSARNDAHGWAVGYNLGVLVEPRDGTRIGASFHSEIRQTLKGTTDFVTGGPVGQTVSVLSGGAFVSTGAKAGINLPAIATVGVFQEIGRHWAVMADVQWLGWHTLNNITSIYSNPAQSPTVIPLNWHDSWFITAGARYQLKDNLAIRFGVAYDETPTRDATRVPGISNLNSIWTSIGLQYKLTDKIKMDVAYGHVFSAPGQIEQTVANPANTFRGNLSGKVSGTVDYVAAQIAMQF